MRRGLDSTIEDAVRQMLGASDHDRAATALIRGYGPRILDYLRATLRDEGLAGDAFSQFGENVWRGITTYRGDGSVLAWSYALAWSAVTRVTDSGYLRRRQRLATTEAGQLVAEVQTATRPYQRTEIKDAVARLREQLAVDEQTLLYLRVDQDLAWGEVATIMRVDAAVLRKRFERVKDKLRALATASGLIPD